MMTTDNLIELLIYPIEKIFVFLSSIQIGGLSLFSILLGALVIEIIFHFFVGQHSFAGGASNARTGDSSSGHDGSDNRSN